MQIFEKLLGDIHRHKIDNFKSWLFTVSRNHCLMDLRKKKVTVAFEDYHEKSDDSFVESMDEEHPLVVKEKELTLLEEGIGQLKDEQRDCVKYFFLQGKSYDEVADITGFELKKVKSYIQNGKRNLRIYMEANG